MVKVKFLVFSISKTHFIYFITHPTSILLFFTSKPNIVHLFINFFLTFSLPQNTHKRPTQLATKIQQTHTIGHTYSTTPATGATITMHKTTLNPTTHNPQPATKPIITEKESKEREKKRFQYEEKKKKR